MPRPAPRNATTTRPMMMGPPPPWGPPMMVGPSGTTMMPCTPSPYQVVPWPTSADRGASKPIGLALHELSQQLGEVARQVGELHKSVQTLLERGGDDGVSSAGQRRRSVEAEREGGAIAAAAARPASPAAVGKLAAAVLEAAAAAARDSSAPRPSQGGQAAAAAAQDTEGVAPRPPPAAAASGNASAADPCPVDAPDPQDPSTWRASEPVMPPFITDYRMDRPTSLKNLFSEYLVGGGGGGDAAASGSDRRRPALKDVESHYGPARRRPLRLPSWRSEKVREDGKRINTQINKQVKLYDRIDEGWTEDDFVRLVREHQPTLLDDPRNHTNGAIIRWLVEHLKQTKEGYDNRRQRSIRSHATRKLGKGYKRRRGGNLQDEVHHA